MQQTAINVSALVQELEDLFLSLAWTLQSRTAEVTGEKQAGQLFFEPLNKPSGYAGNNSAPAALIVLDTLVRRLDPGKRKPHLFLKNMSPGLVEILTDPGLNSDNLVISGFLNRVSKFFDPKNPNPGRPYWKVRKLYEVRASNAHKTRNRWIGNVARRLWEEHIKLQQENVRMGLGLVRN